jgi:perosamine synthetase
VTRSDARGDGRDDDWGDRRDDDRGDRREARGDSREARGDSREAATARARTGARTGAGSPGAELDEIPLARPVLGEAEERAVLDVLRSGRLSLGPCVKEFEQAFAARLGARCASAVSSGTAGLHLALRAVGVSDGDEVVTSPFSFVASANVALYERARPVFADIDPVTLNLDPAAAEAALGERTRAILPVHIFGYPAAMDEFERIAASADVALVEDACEALGAVHPDGIAVGARGHPAVFAFYANKQLTTGEGGVVTLGSHKRKEAVDAERNQGRAPDMGWLDHDRLGFNYRLSDIACALGLAQLGHLDEMLDGRARVAGLYREALEGIEGLTLPCADAGGARRSWFVFVVQLPHGVDRDEAVRALASRGIQSKPYLPAIHLMSFYRERFGHREGEFPVCEDVSARSLALPLFPTMSEGQVERVAKELRAHIERVATAPRVRAGQR